MNVVRKRPRNTSIALLVSTWAPKTGLVGLYVFSFFAFLGHSASAAGLLLMLFSLFGRPAESQSIVRNDPILWLGGAFAGYLVLHAVIADISPAAQWGAIHEWARLFLFVVIAWWMRGDPKRIYVSLALALLGFFVRLAIDGSASDIETMLDGGRTGFAYSINFAGILSGACLITLVLAAPLVIKRPLKINGRLLIILCWVSCLAVTYQVHIAAQRRGAWIATAIGLVVALAVFAYRSASGQQLQKLVLAIALLVPVALYNAGVFADHISRDRATLSALLHGADMEQIEIKGSAAIRLHMLHFGLKRWLERPLLGWGPGTEVLSDLDYRAFEDPLDRLQARELPHTHLHNQIVTVLVQLGAIGAGFFVVLIYFVVREMVIAHRKELLPAELFALISGVLVALFVSTLTTTPLRSIEFQLLVALYLGAAYSTRYKMVTGPAH
jgi:O-antigen ligase